jgi:ABC-type nitrate/sulfonate/bicarbonate transport system permease component
LSIGYVHGVALILALFAGEDIASRLGWIDAAKFPPASNVAATVASMIADGTLWPPLVHTLACWAAAVVVSLLLGGLAGVALGQSRWLANVAYVPVELARPVPSTALIPLVILSIGANEQGAFFLTVFGTVWQVLPIVVHGTRHADPMFDDVARSIGLTRWQTFRSVTLPRLLPTLLTAARVATSAAFVLLVSMEFLAGIDGIGKEVLIAYTGANYVRMYAACAVAIALGCVPAVWLALRASRDIDEIDGANRGDARHDASRADKIVQAGAAVVAVLLWWKLSADSQNPFFPPLQMLVADWADYWRSARGLHDIGSTVSNMAAGLAVGIVGGAFAGFALSRRRARLVFAPLLGLVRATPSVILLPITISFLGIGDQMKIANIALAVAWPVLITTQDGCARIPAQWINTSRVLGLGPLKRFVHVVFPAVLPHVLAGVAVALPLSLIVAVTSEMVGATLGIGSVILGAQTTFDVQRMWSGVLILSVLGYALNHGFSRLRDVLQDRFGS